MGRRDTLKGKKVPIRGRTLFKTQSHKPTRQEKPCLGGKNQGGNPDGKEATRENNNKVEGEERRKKGKTSEGDPPEKPCARALFKKAAAWGGRTTG